jgi:hypothetical protein
MAKLKLKPGQMDWRTNSASLLRTAFLPSFPVAHLITSSVGVLFAQR